MTRAVSSMTAITILTDVMREYRGLISFANKHKGNLF